MPRPDKTLIPVRFGRQWKQYNGGDVAGFHPLIAANLIRTGIAKPVTPGKVTTTTPSVVVPEHLGGGWYLVGDQRVKGKKAAMKIAAELAVTDG